MSHSINQNDPRVIRTRQLILDAFVLLLGKKDFTSITVSDITKQATINRATFYAHFSDKYTLLDTLLSDSFMTFILNRVQPQALLTSETFKNLVLSLCDYHETSSMRCVKNFESVAPFVEKNIKIKLEIFISNLLSNSCIVSDKRTIDLSATMISWSIYGVTYRWNLEGRNETPLDLAEKVLPLLEKLSISQVKNIP
ncbi:TetR/AcrR family transcriptional regulator [Priestia megaterium]|uniref:TetR/AcrR family transcriptional regulator n=1 Tax=Priestia megaterium TaxID=1404 RepID=UPI00278A8BC0|nr:AcrR family transcriptional regulator [Bacillus sp. 1751]